MRSKVFIFLLFLSLNCFRVKLRAGACPLFDDNSEFPKTKLIIEQGDKSELSKFKSLKYFTTYFVRSYINTLNDLNPFCDYDLPLTESDMTMTCTNDIAPPESVGDSMNFKRQFIFRAKGQKIDATKAISLIFSLTCRAWAEEDQGMNIFDYTLINYDLRIGHGSAFQTLFFSDHEYKVHRAFMQKNNFELLRILQRVCHYSDLFFESNDRILSISSNESRECKIPKIDSENTTSFTLICGKHTGKQHTLDENEKEPAKKKEGDL